MMRYFIFAFILSVMSCSSDGTDQSLLDEGYDYFPIIEKGTTYLYEVEQTLYTNDGNEILSEVFYQREETIESESLDRNQGSFRTEIWQSKTGSDPWKFIGNSSLELNPLQAVGQENNARIVSLSFPTSQGKEWDGLTLLGDVELINVGGESMDFYKNWSFKILDIGPVDTYDDVVSIQQADHENAVERRYSIEKYAKNIGLIYKEQMILDTQCLTECEGMPWEEKAQKGIIMRKSLVSIN